MGRRANPNPTIKRSIQVSDSFWKFALRYCNESEPMWLAMDRMMNYYIQNKEEIVEQFETSKRTISKLYDRIHEMEQKYMIPMECFRL